MINKLSSPIYKQIILFCLGITCLVSILKLQSVEKKRISEVTLTKEAYLKQQEREQTVTIIFSQEFPFLWF